ncbi:hypothetical protein AC249_AIPGENE23161 [Exaiptasia diaphana]|nr:hypothetical protein AC249_AIPGENE23161 [Exaiptasia diaphana]
MENLPTNSQHHSKRLQLHNAFYALVSVVSQTGQIATLPLWIDSGLPSNATVSNSTDGFRPFMDETFVTIFTGFFLVVVYGVMLAVKAFISGKNCQRFNFKLIPSRQLVLTSLCGSVAAILTMFSASGKRTAPYLQSILLNSTIPATVVLRYCILKKSPTRKKLICATVTVLSLFVCLLPSIVPKIDPKSNQGNVQGGAKGFAKVIWPLIFIIAFIFQALTYIASEKLLQSTRSLTVVSVLFLMQCLMFVFTLSSIFLDALPFFGNVDNLAKVALK